jgi:hypothetical protein
VDVVVGYAQDAERELSEHLGASLVVLALGRVIVDTTVELEDEALRGAVEVDDEAGDELLAPSADVLLRFLYEFHDERLIEQAQQQRPAGQVAYIPEQSAPLARLAGAWISAKPLGPRRGRVRTQSVRLLPADLIPPSPFSLTRPLLLREPVVSMPRQREGGALVLRALLPAPLRLPLLSGPAHRASRSGLEQAGPGRRGLGG